MSEHKNKNAQERYEGEVISPEELEGEDVKDVKASDSKKETETKKDSIFNRAGSAVKDKLDSISLWDVVKGVALLGGGIVIGIAGTKFVESRRQQEEYIDLPFDDAPAPRIDNEE